MFLKALAFNAASRGVSCGAALRSILVRHSISLVATSEANIPAAARVAFAAEWKRYGWFAVFSAPEEQGCHVCLLSRIPLKQVSVCSQDGATRHAAALLDLKSARGPAPLLAIAVYLQSGKPQVAQAQANDTLSGALASGRRCLAFGDWNLVQEEGELAALLQANVVHACDEAAWGQDLPPTGPVFKGSRRRRVDYAVSVGDIHATAVHHVAEEEVGRLSDHRLVFYSFDVEAPPSLRGPRRRQLLDKDALPPADGAPPESAVASFHECLRQGDVDEAWHQLSDMAEDLVCKPAGSPQGFVPRSQAWLPQQGKKRSDFEAEMDKSPGLRALRRLHTRLLLCAYRPWDGQLLRATGTMAARARAKVPALGFVQCDDPAASQQVQQLIATLEEEEKQLRLEKWRSLVQCDPARVRSYVKRRADAALAVLQEPEEATKVKDKWHPAVAVEEQAERWTEAWCKPPGHDPAAIERILAAVPQPRPCTLQFEFSPGLLQDAMRAMRGKAAGADDWRPSEMLHLPSAWWDLASQLWSTILEVRRVPCIWKQAKVALLWKAKQKTRPMLPAMWRAGCRVLKDQLRPWIESWQEAHVMGGIPTTSVATSLMQIRRAFDEGCSCFAQLDVSAYFDSIGPFVLRRCMEHLHLPLEISDLLGHFYQGAQRIFSMSQAISGRWREISMGIAQGCPLSPMLASAIGHIWCSWIRSAGPRDGPRCLSYVDDRTLWVPAGSPCSLLRQALHRSQEFDQAFGFALSLDKSAIVTRDPDPQADALAAEFGFKRAFSLEILGVQASFTSEWSLLKFQVDKALARLRLLCTVTSNRSIHCHLLASLVTPCFAWAAGFARPEASELSRVRAAVVDLFGKSFTGQAATVIVFEAMGWKLEPEFACDLGALRVLWRSCALAPEWLDTAPLTQARFDWRAMIPEAAPVLAKYGWSLDERGLQLCRRDRAGALRVLRPGVDSFRCVFAWLRQHFRQVCTLRTGRVERKFHRSEEGLATGLDLPPPDGGEDFHFGGHRRALRAQLRGIDLSLLGAGGSCWYFNGARRHPEGHERWSCMCNLKYPARPHLLWVCEHTAECRTGLRLPLHRAEERLLATTTPEFPQAPPGVDHEELFDDLADSIEVQMRERMVLYVGSDGSEADEVGAFAVGLHPGDFVCSGGHGHEDQCAFKQEMLAFDLAARATAAAAERCAWQGRAVFVLDCQSALTAVLSNGDNSVYPVLVNSVRGALAALRRLAVQLNFVWVPSHGKRPLWEAPAGMCTETLRLLNAKVDREAAVCRQRRGQGSLREAWCRRREVADQWEYAAIRAGSAAAALLKRKLEGGAHSSTSTTTSS